MIIPYFVLFDLHILENNIHTNENIIFVTH